MGQYFNFYNITKDEEGNYPCSWNFGCPWAKNMEKMSDEKITQIFIEQIKGNEWSFEDDIIADGDYGDGFSWKDYKPKADN